LIVELRTVDIGNGITTKQLICYQWNYRWSFLNWWWYLTSSIRKDTKDTTNKGKQSMCWRDLLICCSSKGDCYESVHWWFVYL